MITNKPKTIYILICLITLLLNKSGAGIQGSLKCNYIFDSNVYDDYRNFSDSGLDTGLSLNYMGKLGEYIYPRFNFEYSLKEFPVYNLNNQNSTLLNGTVKFLLGEFFTASFETGSDIYNLPYQNQYSTTLFYLIPSLKFYPYYFTEIEAGLIDNNVTYPNYDLDYQANKIYVQFEQEIHLDTTLKLLGITGDRNYNERMLYDTSSTTYPVLSSEYRHDTELSYSVKLERYMEGLGDLKVGYNYEKLDSNDNEFYWGPLQSEYSNTSGDEQVLSNYWDYELTNLNISIKSNISHNLLLNVYWHNQDKIFTGWMARDSSDSFLTPNQSRHDIQQVISLGIENSTGNITIKAGLSLTNNQSNDYPYNYNETAVDIGIKLFF